MKCTISTIEMKYTMVASQAKRFMQVKNRSIMLAILSDDDHDGKCKQIFKHNQKDAYRNAS
jgi:hypothetical protein